jgi:hypothetical protein
MGLDFFLDKTPYGIAEHQVVLLENCALHNLSRMIAPG